MFQNLLVDEFKLQFHEETKNGPVYALRLDKSREQLGLKLEAQKGLSRSYAIDEATKPSSYWLF